MVDKVRRKILALSFNDIKQPGHAYSIIKGFDSELFDARLITKYSEYGVADGSLYSRKSIQYFLYHFCFRKILGRLWNLFTKSNIYAFCRSDLIYPSVNKILRLYDGIPDCIIFFSTDGFLTSKDIKTLHDITKAKLVFVFVDQFFLGSGCHYSCECTGYQSNCDNCPAFHYIGKSLIRKKREKTINYLINIEKVVAASPYDISKAKKSKVFADSIFIDALSMDNRFNIYSKKECRRFFNIPNDSLVIMYGASSTKNLRKGYAHFAKAIDILCSQIKIQKDKIIVLLAGYVNDSDREQISGVDVVVTGYLDMDALAKAFQASDVFVSTTLDDSGPKMVNFAIELNVPVVSYPVGAAVSLVEHKNNGYIAQYSTPEDVANGLNYILFDDSFDKDVCRDKCEAIKEFYSNKESWQERLIKVLE